MGQSQGPVSAGTQQLNETLSVNSSGTGTATFVFPAPPIGKTWTGTITCPMAPSSALFVATIGATPWGTWAGNSIFGPIQARANQQITVTATGLVASTDYELEWNGSSDDENTVQPIWPDPNATALSASISGSVTSVNPIVNIGTTGLTTAANVGSFTYNPATANAQIIRVSMWSINSPSLAAPEGQVQLNAINASRGSTFWEGTVDVPPRPAGANNFAPACVVPIPIPMDAGDNVGLTATLLTAGIVAPQQIAIQVDAVSGAQPILSTPGLPQGVFLAGGVYIASVAVPASTPTQILAAPLRGMVYRFHSFGIVASTGPYTSYTSYICQLQNGSGTPYIGKINVFPSGQTGACDSIPCFGQTSDVGLAVNVFQVGIGGATNPTFYVRYDTIAAVAVL